MYYEIEIAGLRRKLPLCRVNDSLYIGAFIMFGDVEITKAAATELLKLAPEPPKAREFRLFMKWLVSQMPITTFLREKLPNFICATSSRQK